jgi:hypothetical protein
MFMRETARPAAFAHSGRVLAFRGSGCMKPQGSMSTRPSTARGYLEGPKHTMPSDRPTCKRSASLEGQWDWETNRRA